MNRLTFLSAVSNSAVASGRSLSAFIMAVVLGLAFAGAAMAQTTSKVDVRNFEVISVDGNNLVVRDERGTNELTVPPDFRFTVDGKKMSVSELKPGMKGTATVTTKTTVTPVFVTQVKDGVVLKAGPSTVEIRDDQGVRKRFTQDQLDQRGMQIIKDGKVIRVGQLREGDTFTAVLVTKAEPVVLTEKDVQATTAPGKAEPMTASKAGQSRNQRRNPKRNPKRNPPRRKWRRQMRRRPPPAPSAAPQPAAVPPASPPGRIDWPGDDVVRADLRASRDSDIRHDASEKTDVSAQQRLVRPSRGSASTTAGGCARFRGLHPADRQGPVDQDAS